MVVQDVGHRRRFTPFFVDGGPEDGTPEALGGVRLLGRAFPGVREPGESLSGSSGGAF